MDFRGEPRGCEIIVDEYYDAQSVTLGLLSCKVPWEDDRIEL